MKTTNIKLAITGFLQVYFVAINTVFLSRSNYIGVLIAAFLISFVWSWNVHKISVSTIYQKLVYAFGASIGSVAGLLTTKLF